MYSERWDGEQAYNKIMAIGQELKRRGMYDANILMIIYALNYAYARPKLEQRIMNMIIKDIGLTEE